MTKPFIIGIAGGSGSGKSFLTAQIARRIRNHNVIIIEHDFYYKDLSQLCPEKRNNINFDHPDALETDLLISDLNLLLNHKPVNIPNYDFSCHERRTGFTVTEPVDIVIVEGILVMSDIRLCNLMDIKVFIDADDDIRFIKRLLRDTIERGRDYNSVIKQYLNTVKPMHSSFVAPSKANADIIIQNDYSHNSVNVLLSFIANTIHNIQ